MSYIYDLMATSICRSTYYTIPFLLLLLCPSSSGPFCSFLFGFHLTCFFFAVQMERSDGKCALHDHAMHIRPAASMVVTRME